MPQYQNSSVAERSVEIGNYTISVGAVGATAGSAWVNLGAGMLKTFAYVPEMFTSQAGNAVDPIQGVARETATFDFDLIEYDGSAFSNLSGGLITGTSGSLVVGGNASVQLAKAFKLANRKLLSTGTSVLTTIIAANCFMNTGFTMTPKSDNDADPVNVYSFSILAKQYATAQNIFTKTVV
jgi:hypothetical protein